jgi:hypothetical protein
MITPRWDLNHHPPRSISQHFVQGIETALHEALLHSAHRTLYPEEAVWFYVPVYTACSQYRHGDSPGHWAGCADIRSRGAFTSHCTQRVHSVAVAVPSRPQCVAVQLCSMRCAALQVYLAALRCVCVLLRGYAGTGGCYSPAPRTSRRATGGKRFVPAVVLLEDVQRCAQLSRTRAPHCVPDTTVLRVPTHASHRVPRSAARAPHRVPHTPSAPRAPHTARPVLSPGARVAPGVCIRRLGLRPRDVTRVE